MHEKLDISDVFRTIFATYRDQAALLLPAALIVYLPVAILSVLVGIVGGTAGAIVLGLVSIVFSLVASFWYQGMVVQAARDMQDGVRDFDLGSLLRSVTPVLGALIAAGLLAGLGIAAGFILLIVPGLLLLTWWALLAPVVVVEHPGVAAALGRSRQLVRGNGWQVFGVIVLLGIAQLLLGVILRAIFGGGENTGVGAAIASLIANVLVAPLSALAATTMYLRLRQVHGEPAISGGREGTVVGGGAGAGAPAAPGRPSPAAEGASAPLSSRPGPGSSTEPGHSTDPGHSAEPGPGSEPGRDTGSRPPHQS